MVAEIYSLIFLRIAGNWMNAKAIDIEKANLDEQKMKLKARYVESWICHRLAHG